MVNFKDLDGDEPTPAEAARIAAHVYGNRDYLWPKDMPSVYNGHSIDNIIKNFGVNPDI